MKNRKKILFLVTQSEFGGAQRFIYTLVTALRRRYTQNQFASQNTQINADNQRESVNVGNQRPSAYPKGDNQRVSASTDNQRASAIDYEVVIAAGPEGDNANGLLFNLEKENFKVFPLKFLKRSINPIIDFLGILEIRKLIKKQNPDILFLCSTKAGFLGSLAARGYTQIGSRQVENTQIHADNQRESAHPEGQNQRISASTDNQRPSAYPKGDNQRISARLKVIYRIGGWTFNDPWPKWKKKLYLWLEKKTARFKDFIVNNSQLESEQAKKLGIKPKKEILTIYNGIDTGSLGFLPSDGARSFLEGKIQSSLSRSQFTPRSTPLSAGVKGRCKGDLRAVIGTIANLYPAKGLEYLIKAANLIFKSLSPEPRTPNIKFVIIGEGEERSNLEDLIRKNNLNNVFLAGAIPDAWKYLKAFDIFILPSLKEGFPWTLIEAMAAEVPVIATKAGAIPEIIEHKKSGILIESGNPQAIASAITELLDDEKLREDLVKEGRKKVCEKFTLDKMVSEFEKLFNDADLQI